jgi:hypothetical protein
VGRRGRGKGFLALVVVVVVALVVAVVELGPSSSDPTRSPGAATTPAIAGEPGTNAVGEPPVIEKGPSLGEAWTTPPDPANFILIEDETPVASDQYLVVFEDGTPVGRAEAAAAAIDGEIIGHFAYLDTWKVGAFATEDVETWYARKAILERQPGVTAVAAVALVVSQAGPDCAPALGDPVYAGENAKPYEMIGVRAAWEAYYASGLPKTSVHLGISDSALTKGGTGNKPGWEFDNVTFADDPTTTNEAGYHHSDGTLGLIAADGTNGGITGIASPLGSNLVVSHSVLSGGVENGTATSWEDEDGISYTDANLLNTIRQIESGATIIHGSWSGSTVSAANAGTAAMWEKFFAKMARDQKTSNVLFVFSAGNEESALDGKNSFPGGIKAPNVITVGNIQTGGKRNWSSNRVDPTVPGGEVTLGAPGEQAVRGEGIDLARNGGTSSAAPMVTAAAVLVRAIDPTLTAAEIKELIAGSADDGDPEVGGKVLRVDLAVRKAIDGARARAGLPELTDKMIAAGRQSCTVTVTGSILRRLESPAGATEWSITGSLATVPGPTALSLVVGGARPTDWRQAIGGPAVKAKWKVLAPKSGVVIIVTRLDNGFWVKHTLRDDGRPAASPTTNPTAEPTAMPTPAPTSRDCSAPPPGVKPGTLKYAMWSAECRAIAP